MKPNFLFIIVDELRYPTVYENAEIKKWRKKNLRAEEYLKKNGCYFEKHYTASTACAPSRTSIFTGQYPSLHGVTQTDATAKGPSDPDLFWLDSNTVPTLGNYFQNAGYYNKYIGKWHISHVSDILIPGTQTSLLSYDQDTGVPDPTLVRYYKEADRLKEYGFHEYVGPEPHGSDPHNSGSSAKVGESGRDKYFKESVIKTLKSFAEKDEHLMKHGYKKPFFLVASFVNPHDISLYGEITKNNPKFNFPIDPSVPIIPPSPTAGEFLLPSKPDCQQSYKDLYPLGLQPTLDDEYYRKLYYSLNLTVDKNIMKILKTLEKTGLDKSTIVVFTSDHGDLLGAHGLFQKWYNSYEEAIHVPLIVKIPPQIGITRKKIKVLTSSVDLLPTFIGLANIDIDKVQHKLSKSHSQDYPLVGKDLSRLIMNQQSSKKYQYRPILFTTNDNIFRGLNQVSWDNKPYNSTTQPVNVYTAISYLEDGGKTLYKYSRYINNSCYNDSYGTPSDDSMPDEPQFELYNITDDPTETNNLAYLPNSTLLSQYIQDKMDAILNKQILKKLIYPRFEYIPEKFPPPS